jgi:hypothetical protein
MGHEGMPAATRGRNEAVAARAFSSIRGRPGAPLHAHGSVRDVEKVLFAAELGGGFGHVRRLLPLARAAAAMGYDPSFWCGARKKWRR